MKIIVASGKGGVGKSMLASSLAILISQEKKVIALDCDVDAPNLAVWLGGVTNWNKSKKISTIEKPKINLEKCNGCGLCVKNCQFGALSIKNEKAQINNFVCEGCRACKIVCPQKAIEFKKIENAQIDIKNKTKFGFPLLSAQLFPGESGSGKIVAELKKEANEFHYEIMLIDSAPGTGCPVNAAMLDANLAILVTEPTPSGISDLKRVLEVVNHFGIPYWVVINKWDINPESTQRIEKEFSGKILGKISYDKNIFKAISKLIPIVKTNLKAKDEIIKIFLKIKENL
jgi:MinD superfamily P-loop ATPase